MLIALKILVFTVVVPGTIAVWIPLGLLNPTPGHRLEFLGDFHYSGAALMIVGAAIYLWCAWDFGFAGRGTPAPIDPPKRLVVRGLYKWVRNPMYVGVLSFVIGEAIWFESRNLLVYGGIVFLGFSAFVIFYEEPTLKDKFGEAYHLYCEATPRWIPGFRRPQGWRIEK